jgi:hypothetical protein
MGWRAGYDIDQSGLCYWHAWCGQGLGARRLAALIDVPHIELDSFKLLPGRQIADPDDVGRSIRATVCGEQWILDGNWADDDLAAEVWSMADLIVWVDYPRGW